VTLASIADEAREAAASVAWRQWAELGGMASSDRRARSLVDPEALVLVSLALRDHERRLWDIAYDWALNGARLLSVQRMKNLRPMYDEMTRDRLNEFAAVAAEEAGDARWSSRFFGKPARINPRRKKEWGVDLHFVGQSGLMLRLRRAFGVNVKADVLALLIGLAGKHITVRLMARALHYTVAGIRSAADDLGDSRLVHATRDDRPTTYTVDISAWKRVLELPGIPEWCHWNEVFAFVTALSAWEQSAPDKHVSGYALNALGRELILRHRAAFARSQLLLQVPTAKGIDAPAGQFAEHVDRLTTWMHESA
jgi:hypothetical protein